MVEALPRSPTASAFVKVAGISKVLWLPLAVDRRTALGVTPCSLRNARMLGGCSFLVGSITTRRAALGRFQYSRRTTISCALRSKRGATNAIPAASSGIRSSPEIRNGAISMFKLANVRLRNVQGASSSDPAIWLLSARKYMRRGAPSSARRREAVIWSSSR